MRRALFHRRSPRGEARDGGRRQPADLRAQGPVPCLGGDSAGRAGGRGGASPPGAGLRPHRGHLRPHQHPGHLGFRGPGIAEGPFGRLPPAPFDWARHPRQLRRPAGEEAILVRTRVRPRPARPAEHQRDCEPRGEPPGVHRAEGERLRRGLPDAGGRGAMVPRPHREGRAQPTTTRHQFFGRR